MTPKDLEIQTLRAKVDELERKIEVLAKANKELLIEVDKLKVLDSQEENESPELKEFKEFFKKAVEKTKKKKELFEEIDRKNGFGGIQK